MRLLENDYLGGHGSRGSGEITFEDIEIRVRRPKDYAFPFNEGVLMIEHAPSLLEPPLNDVAMLAQVRAAIGG